MKTNRLNFAFLICLGLAAFLFQGCYTRLAVIHEVEPAYQEPSYQESAYQEDTTYQQEEQTEYNQNYDDNYYDDYNYSHPRNYLGFSYYYPSWRINWGWDAYIYPSYWDPWWTPLNPYYGYSPYYSHWYSYPGYGYYAGPYNYNYYYRQQGTRNFGYQRGGNIRRDDATVRATTTRSAETGATYNGRTGSTRGSINIPNASSSGTRQTGTSSATVRSNRGGAAPTGKASSRVSTNRSTQGNRQSGVQQSRTQNPQRVGQSRGAAVQRGNSSGQSSRSNAPAPSYTPAPQRTSPPPSAPAPRSDDSGQRSSGSGRSRR